MRDRFQKNEQGPDQGKVETFIGYVRGSFYVPLASQLRAGGLKVDRDTADARVGTWLREIAGAQRKKDGKLVEVTAKRHHNGAYNTAEMLALEAANIALMCAGVGHAQVAADAKELVARAAARGLSEGQTAAPTLVLTGADWGGCYRRQGRGRQDHYGRWRESPTGNICRPSSTDFADCRAA
jgi:hypothetical protein